MDRDVDTIVVLITAPTRESGSKIAEILVSERLAACVNVVPEISSFFHWNGSLDKADEVLLIAKSRSSYFEKLRSRIRAVHSYETPEIIALPVIFGDDDYLSWVTESVGSATEVR